MDDADLIEFTSTTDLQELATAHGFRYEVSPAYLPSISQPIAIQTINGQPLVEPLGQRFVPPREVRREAHALGVLVH